MVDIRIYGRHVFLFEVAEPEAAWVTVKWCLTLELLVGLEELLVGVVEAAVLEAWPLGALDWNFEAGQRQ